RRDLRAAGVRRTPSPDQVGELLAHAGPGRGAAVQDAGRIPGNQRLELAYVVNRQLTTLVQVPDRPLAWQQAQRPHHDLLVVAHRVAFAPGVFWQAEAASAVLLRGNREWVHED